MTHSAELCLECQERPADTTDGSYLCLKCSRQSHEDFRLAMTYALRSACCLSDADKPPRQITHVELQNAPGTNPEALARLIRDGLDRLAREYRRVSMWTSGKARVEYNG